MLSPPLRVKSTSVKVPRLGLNCGNVRRPDHSVIVDGMGVDVVIGPIVAAPTGAATPRPMTARTKTHKQAVIGIFRDHRNTILKVRPQFDSPHTAVRNQVQRCSSPQTPHAAKGFRRLQCGMGKGRIRSPPQHPAMPEGLSALTKPNAASIRVSV